MGNYTQPVAFGPLAGISNVRIGNASGDVVATIRTDGAFARWNPVDQQAATGIYFYIITDENGNRWRGKFAVIP